MLEDISNWMKEWDEVHKNDPDIVWFRNHYIDFLTYVICRHKEVEQEIFHRLSERNEPEKMMLVVMNIEKAFPELVPAAAFLPNNESLVNESLISDFID